MTEQENGSLSLDEVVRRFADSEQALGQAREKLEALAAAEATQSAAARSLEETSAAAKDLVVTARTLILEAEQTQQTARAVLEAGAVLIDGTYLKELRDGVTQTATAVKEGFENVEELLGQVRERDQRIAELETELRRRTDALSNRQRNKLGLT